MKRSAIALLLLPLLCLCIFLMAPDKEHHASSPAFSVALNQAIDKLEGTAARVTSAATPVARAGALDLTTDPITCDAGSQCQGLTTDSRPCYTLQDAEPTCDQQSETCDMAPTCHGAYTCDDRTTCTGGATCDGSYTCWNSTCEEPGMTCDGTSTCDQGAGCDFTADGTHTCNGVATCQSTCDGWPTCAGSNTCDVTCSGSTCDGTATCDGNETCQYTCCQAAWPECVGITCNSGFTCDGSNTCDGMSPTCTNTCSVWPTCQANPVCGFTFDGTSTCDGAETCQNTCTDWPTCNANDITCEGYPAYTCDPKNKRCCNATEHTSWGKLKKMAK